MKIPPPHLRRPPSRAFSITEVMVAMAVFSMVVSGIVYSHLVGIKMYEISKTKLGINDYARRALIMLVRDIREAKRTRVGTGNASEFTEAVWGTPLQGNALQLDPTIDTNNFIRYYLDADRKLKRVTDTNTTPTTVADYITNNVVFAAEDFRGNVLTNNQSATVISFNLNFYKIEFPQVAIGAGGYYDYYQIRSKVTRRAIE